MYDQVVDNTFQTMIQFSVWEYEIIFIVGLLTSVPRRNSVDEQMSI